MSEATNILRWTKERPKGEGWYWMRADFMDTTIITTAELANIFQTVPQALTDPAVEFAGPIPEPTPSPGEQP